MYTKTNQTELQLAMVSAQRAFLKFSNLYGIIYFFGVRVTIMLDFYFREFGVSGFWHFVILVFQDFGTSGFLLFGNLVFRNLFLSRFWWFEILALRNFGCSGVCYF